MESNQGRIKVRNPIAKHVQDNLVYRSRVEESKKRKADRRQSREFKRFHESF